MRSRFQASATVHHGVVSGRTGALPLTLCTAAERWAYAVSFGRADDDGPDTSAPFAVRVTAAVDRGRIGIGCLNRDDSAFLDEAFVAAGDGLVTVELVADAPASTGSLVVRNVAEDGPSEATVVDVACAGIADTVVGGWPGPLTRPRVVAGWGRAYSTRGHDLAEKLRLRRFDRLSAPEVMQWPDGVRFRLVPGEQLSRVVSLSGTYEPNTLRLLRSWLPAGAVCVDVGANAGLVSMAAAAWVGRGGRVIAVEPSAREYARLVDTMQLNGATQVTPIHAAVAARTGRRTLRVAAAPTGGANTLGSRFAYPAIEASGVEDVAAFTLDDLVAREGLGRVDVVKVDAEGAEVEVLDGAAVTLRRHRPVLVLEVCAAALAGTQASVGGLEARLRAHDYALFEIDDDSGALRPTAALDERGDRNVVALPGEQAEARLRVVRDAD